MRISGRIRSKIAADALQPALDGFADDLTKNAALINCQGKLKMPKAKKILSPEDQAAKDLTAMFKKLHGQCRVTSLGFGV